MRAPAARGVLWVFREWDGLTAGFETVGLDFRHRSDIDCRIVSDETQGPKIEDGVSPEGRSIVEQECDIFGRVLERVERDSHKEIESIENLDGAMVELRDLIAEAKEEDVSSLIGQMHQVAALNAKQGKGRSVPVDPKNPYFGHMSLLSANSNKPRDVMIGKRTMLDDGDGLSIVDWRNAPVSRLFYRFEEGDDYEEEFDDRVLEGTVLVRRSLSVSEGNLRRIDSPQGSYFCDRDQCWHERVGRDRPSLTGGSGVAARVPRGRLGVQDDDVAGRADKHLQEITALIDREQFDLITRPESGIVLIQGGAGSGKTTVALHRVAYLAFQDRRRFAPTRMLVMVFNEALVEYIRHVLPSLGVEGVAVMTYRRWSLSLLQRLRLPVVADRSEATPEPVSRFKKHRVVIAMIEELVEESVAHIREALQEKVVTRDGGERVLEQFEALSKLAPAIRCDRLLDWLRKGKGASLPARTKAGAETIVRAARTELRDVLADWIELFGDAERIRRAIAEHASDAFTDTDVASIARWCGQRAALVADDLERRDEAANRSKEDEDEEDDEDEEKEVYRPPMLDGEDDAVLLRLMQAKLGGLYAGQKRIEYEHIVIDEAQDLCPLEMRVLLDCATEGRSVTIAGDKAQKMIFDNGFRDWPQLLADAGLPHVAVQPLKITYRSTRQVMDIAQHVLGPLHDEKDALIARDGAPVSFYDFGEVGEAVVFLADALRNLMAREPSASVALITRFPQQAEVYYDALRVAEVPRVRLVIKQNFSFQPGIDVTDVRHVKGLEFDYVVLLDPTKQNYPERTESRHLLHIAATRTAYQLWIVCSGAPSPLLPNSLVELGEMSG